METLHGYAFDETQWKCLGGNGQCVAARKDSRDFFLKRLNKPKYPESSNFSGEFKKKKAAECETWLKRRKAIAEKLPGTGSGNTIKPVEYFREGACYYEVTNMVNITNIPYTDIWKESRVDKARLMLTIAASLSDIHKAGIVHGDLDPGNILITRSAAGHLITKLIDFTDAFFENDPPESIMSKDAWWSPEVAMYSKAHGQEPNPFRGYIGTKTDVFSLGLIFHQYCTRGGNFPKHEGVDYPWQVFMKNDTLSPDEGIEPEFKELISAMLRQDWEERPGMEDVCKALRRMVDGKPAGPVRASAGAMPESAGPVRASAGIVPESAGPVRVTAGIVPESAGPVPVPAVDVGEGRTRNGSFVASAHLHERNSQKVVLEFSDGKKQIMDLALAVKQNFVKQV